MAPPRVSASCSKVSSDVRIWSETERRASGRESEGFIRVLKMTSEIYIEDDGSVLRIRPHKVTKTLLILIDVFIQTAIKIIIKFYISILLK